MNKLFINKYVVGLSLVELMVALALGAFLSIGIIQVYTSHRQTANNTEGLSQMQDNTRYVLNLMGKSIRNAGYTGCVSKDRGGSTSDKADDIKFDNILNNATGVLYNFEVPVEGFDNVTVKPSVLSSGDPTPLAGTDLLVLRGGVGESVMVANTNTPALFYIDHTGTESNACSGGGSKVSGFCVGDIVAASSCMASLVFQITKLTNNAGVVSIEHSDSGTTPGNSDADPDEWGNSLFYTINQGEGDVVKMETNIYYVATPASSTRPALFRKINNSPAAVVAENVVDMQISYGEDTDSTPDFEVDIYRTADNVVDWARVISTQINLLVASDNDNIVNGTTGMSLPFNGQTYTAPDRRLYRAVTATTTIRNRAQ